MLFTVPFGLLIVCFAMLFGLSANSGGSDVLGGAPDQPSRADNGRWRTRRSRARGGSSASRRRRSFDVNQLTGGESAADYLGYEGELSDDLVDSAARRLDEQTRLHMEQILGDGT